MKRRIQGVAFIVVIASLLGLAVAKYVGVFEGGVPVTLQVDRAGTQLGERADVKVRGLIVGTVADVTSTGSGAVIEMSIDPEMIGMIPAGVSARLLPKTLFGERFISLEPPAESGGPMLAAGDVITEDRSQSARELERVLDGLLPLLQAVEPQDLATTLGALSQALEGRGENLGATLVRLQQLTSGLEPGIPDLQEDITQLADFSANLNAAAPDLLDALEDFTVTSRTIVEQREELRDLFGGLTTASDDLRAFLDRNGENLISLAASARPTLESLARYSPEFPCLFNQLANLIPRGDAAFGKGTDKPGIYVTIEIVNNKGKYIANQDEPEYQDDRGPRCYPILPLSPEVPTDGPFCDGSEAPTPPVGTPVGDLDDFGGNTFGTGDESYECGTSPGGSPVGEDYSGRDGNPGYENIGYEGMGLPNSAGEQDVLAELIAAQDGGDPSAVPSWSSMMVGPLYRGTEVTFT